MDLMGKGRELIGKAKAHKDEVEAKKAQAVEDIRNDPFVPIIANFVRQQVSGNKDAFLSVLNRAGQIWVDIRPEGIILKHPHVQNHSGPSDFGDMVSSVKGDHYKTWTWDEIADWDGSDPSIIQPYFRYDIGKSAPGKAAETELVMIISNNLQDIDWLVAEGSIWRKKSLLKKAIGLFK